MKISKIGTEEVFNTIQLKSKNENVDLKNVEHVNNKMKEDIRVSIKEEIKKYKEMVKNLPDVRSDRVQELRDAIKQGNYKVDAKEVAKRMLEDIILGAK
ncbi:MAG: flagellar biosynthesis anti-sigma factor FlgM [Deltaproteobacteria bacterium]|nr:MAG: flagellar biosynthesis anti-sigma factor FlgM [Deltaproteobacteria bacterium]